MTEKEKAVENTLKWAGAGDKAFELAAQTEKAKLEGKPIPVTPEAIATTIKGAMKMFLDGNIADNKIKTILSANGLDMNNLRKSIVEQTMARALPKIINSGDIERLAQIADVAGEEPLIPKATKITRERVIIEVDGENVREVEAIEHRQDS